MNHTHTDFADLCDADIASAFGEAIGAVGSSRKAELRGPTPFIFKDPSTIPPRDWILGRWFLRGEITAAIAPGGVGKSSFAATAALSIATGRPLLGPQVWGGPQGVWVFNLEDDSQELSRSISASMLHHKITNADVAGRLFVDSGLDQKLCTAKRVRDGFELIEPVYEKMREFIRENNIAMLIIDPFVSSHDVIENDNGAIDAVVKRWKRVAVDSGCGICLVHHTSKGGVTNGVSAMSSRGAVALTDAARIVLVFNRMDKKTGEGFGISNGNEHRSYFSVEDDKHNRAPPESAKWFRLVSVALNNQTRIHSMGDHIGVVEPWTPPDAMNEVAASDIYAIQQIIANGDTFGESQQANDWIGYAIAEHMGWNVGTPDDKKNGDPQHKRQVATIIKTWVANGVLKKDYINTPKGRPKPIIRVGRELNPNDFPNSKGGVGKGGESGR